MTNSFLYAIIGLLIAGFGVLLYLLVDLKKRAEKPAEDSSLKVMMEWMKEIKQGNINKDNINNYIDYSLIEDNAGIVPHEALRIASMLGIDSQIIEKAQKELDIIAEKVIEID